MPAGSGPASPLATPVRAKGYEGVLLLCRLTYRSCFYARGVLVSGYSSLSTQGEVSMRRRPMCVVCRKRPALACVRGVYKLIPGHDLCGQCYRSQRDAVWVAVRYRGGELEAGRAGSGAVRG